MVLRQIVQHGNGDRGWLTNTRVFVCHPFINFAVFPMGQDYHLPHHMFSTVPHYRLKELHEIMRDIPEYGEKATVVEGYIWPKERPPVRPTVIDVLGPSYAAREFRLSMKKMKSWPRAPARRSGHGAPRKSAAGP
jgi:hypothetical protein